MTGAYEAGASEADRMLAAAQRLAARAAEVIGRPPASAALAWRLLPGGTGRSARWTWDSPSCGFELRYVYGRQYLWIIQGPRRVCVEGSTVMRFPGIEEMVLAGMGLVAPGKGTVNKQPG